MLLIESDLPHILIIDDLPVLLLDKLKDSLLMRLEQQVFMFDCFVRFTQQDHCHLAFLFVV
jgi:hypothetical protein